MKKTMIIILVAIGMIACQGVSKEEYEQVLIEKELLEDEIKERDNSLNEFFSTLNNIEENLAIIKSKENIISKETSKSLEGRDNVRDRINEDIMLIGELMESNRELIVKLNRNLKRSNVRVKELEDMLIRLTQQLEEKEIEISILKDDLAKLNLKVDYLTTKVDVLEEDKKDRDRKIDEKTTELNTAYFAIGSKKELVEQKIISREGGFLGLGKTSVLQPDFDTSYFTKIDITKTPSITIVGKAPSIVTSHPSGSYTLRKDENIFYLDINDYAKFWTASKYLVIMIE
jgi:hypothetical protein